MCDTLITKSDKISSKRSFKSHYNHNHDWVIRKIVLLMSKMPHEQCANNINFCDIVCTVMYHKHTLATPWFDRPSDEAVYLCPRIYILISLHLGVIFYLCQSKMIP